MTADLDLLETGFTQTAWKPPIDEMSFEQWQNLGATLQQIDASLPWWIGDWLNYGEWAWGEAYAQAVEITGMSVDRLNNYKWIANKIDVQQRRDDLSWSHHRAVAAFDPELQADWLERAIENGWSVNELWREIHAFNNAILDPPDMNQNGSEEPHNEDDLEPPVSLVSSPVRRLRYGMKMLLERHLHVAPYDVDHDVVIQAQNIFSETQHAENEDLDDE